MPHTWHWSLPHWEILFEKWPNTAAVCIITVVGNSCSVVDDQCVSFQHNNCESTEYVSSWIFLRLMATGVSGHSHMPFIVHSIQTRHGLRFSCVDGGSAVTKITLECGGIVRFDEASTALRSPALPADFQWIIDPIVWAPAHYCGLVCDAIREGARAAHRPHSWLGSPLYLWPHSSPLSLMACAVIGHPASPTFQPCPLHQVE